MGRKATRRHEHAPASGPGGNRTRIVSHHAPAVAVAGPVLAADGVTLEAAPAGVQGVMLGNLQKLQAASGQHAALAAATAQLNSAIFSLAWSCLTVDGRQPTFTDLLQRVLQVPHVGRPDSGSIVCSLATLHPACPRVGTLAARPLQGSLRRAGSDGPVVSAA